MAITHVDKIAGTCFGDAHNSVNIDRINEAIDKCNDVVSPMDFKGGITLNTDFPTSSAVSTGDYYTILANVTDDDATKTNTLQSFIANDEICWNGTNWTNFGTLRYHADTHATGQPDALTDIAGAATIGGGTTLATVSNKVEMLTNATVGTGAILTLAEPTGGGTDVVTMTAPALTASRAITIPDEDVTLADIALNTAFRIASAPNLLTDRGLVAHLDAIPVDVSGQYQIVTAAAETNTMAIPATTGLMISLYCTEYAVGDRVVTVASPINQTGHTIMTFGAVGDWITLIAITTTGGALAWRIMANDGVATS